MKDTFDMADQYRSNNGNVIVSLDGVALQSSNGNASSGVSDGAGEALGFPTLRIADVPDLGPVHWLVDRLWCDQGCGIIGGHPKSGKSWLLEYLMVCVASGKPAFGMYSVEQGRALLFNAEDRPGRTKERIRMMCHAMEIDFGTLDFHLIDVLGLRLDDASHVEQLRRTVERLRPKFLGLDPLRNMHTCDEDKASQMSPLLVPLRLLQREYGCSVAVCHHYTKDGQGTEKRSAGQKLRGSSVFHGWLDSGLYVTASGMQWDESRKVVVEHRDGENVPPFAFRLQKALGPDGESIWLEHQASADPDHSVEDDEADENIIISILVSAQDPMSLSAIAKAGGKRNGWGTASMRRLVDKRVVDTVQVKGKGQPHVGYFLRG